MENKFKTLLKSRKFWAAVIGLMVVFVGDRAGVDPARLLEAVVVVVGYILGTALEAVSARG
ncbi:MAG: hypothetical protein NTW69_06295 [Chloroflexi bacterium]|nr:hypothetical protein [Chloroflexota bacterium]